MIIERNDELAQLYELYENTASRNGRVALISGGLATGRTELLHTFAEHVTARGGQLLAATGARTERSLRMGVVWQLLRSGPLAPELLDRAARLLGPEPAAEGGAPVRPADARVVHDISALLLGLARERPVVIAVDDVQFADDDSLQVLLSLRRRVRFARVFLLMTEWERPSLPRTALLADVVRQPHRAIVLTPLSPDGVRRLAAARLGEEAAERLAPDCYALSGGNPFLVHALIDDHQRRPDGEAPADHPVSGANFRQAVLDCPHRWVPEVGEIAAGLAVLGEHSTVDLVADLLGAKRSLVAQGLEVLTKAGLVTAGRLRHPEIAAIFVDSIPPERAARFHVRAAERLYELGVEAAEVARHLVAAGAVPGQWAVGLLRHVADQSLVGDVGFAVSCLELALGADADERDLVELRAALVRIAWRVNPSAAARHLGALSEALQAGELGWREAVPVIRHLLWQGDLTAAARQMEAVRAAAGSPDARTAAELRLAAEWVYGSLRDRVPDDLRAVLTEGETPSSPWSRMAAVNSAWAAEGGGDDVLRGAEHILERGLDDVLPEVGASVVLALDHADRPARTRFWSDALAADAERQHATTWQAVLGCARADIAWRRGDLAGAEAQARGAFGLLHSQSWGVLIGLPLSIMVLANDAMGRHDMADELLDRVVPDAMFGTVFGARYLHASGHHHLAVGRPLAALDAFERCGAWMARWDREVPDVVPWRSDLAQAYLRLGVAKNARDLVLEQLGRPAIGASPRLRGISLRVLAAASELKERAAPLAKSVRLLERAGDRLELARSLADLGHAYRDLGQLGRARLALRRAEQVAKACHAKVLTEGLRGPFDRPSRKRGLRDALRPSDTSDTTGVTALSDAERKVAELAALGHTNREISHQLYITVSTVEQHLTRVYRKLNVARRGDLPSELFRHAAAERAMVNAAVTQAG
jgi:DNA-binding CsgD family transcriptional regulator